MIEGEIAKLERVVLIYKDFDMVPVKTFKLYEVIKPKETQQRKMTAFQEQQQEQSKRIIVKKKKIGKKDASDESEKDDNDDADKSKGQLDDPDRLLEDLEKEMNKEDEQD